MKFLVEVATGVVIFSLIGAGAVGLNVVVHYLEINKLADFFILHGLQGAEYALFSVDLILFARFLWRTTSRAWEEL